MRGTEGIHHEDVAQRGIFLCQRLVILAFADVHAAVFQHYHLASGNFNAVEVVGHQPHRLAELVAQPLRHRRQRGSGIKLAFLRATQVRQHQHLGAGIAGGLDRRQGGVEALGRGDAAVVVDRHIQIFADQHALVAQIKITHADDGHGVTPLMD